MHRRINVLPKYLNNLLCRLTGLVLEVDSQTMKKILIFVPKADWKLDD